MHSFIHKYQKIFLAIFLDILIFFLLGFLGFQLTTLIRTSASGPELVLYPLRYFIPSAFSIVTFIIPVLVLGFIHRKLLKTKKEVIIVHLLFFITAIVLPFYYLITTYQRYLVSHSECLAEISRGDYGIACAGGQGFGISIFVLFMIIIYIFILTLISLFINYRSLSLETQKYKKFIIKTIVVLFFLCQIFISIPQVIRESQRQEVLPRPKNQGIDMR